MSIITLLTDFGYKDNFVGVVKGVLLGINPRIHVVDLCHEVEPQNITGAAFALKTAYKYFPKDTIHLVIIDPSVGSGRLPILVKTKEYYFVGPDNGVLSLALEQEEIEGIIYLDNNEFHLRPVSNTFHGRDIFAPVVAHLSKGISYQLFGKAIRSYKKIKLPKPKIGRKCIRGEIIYIDRFGNLFTNVSQDLQAKIKRPRINIKNKSIRGIKSGYARVKPDNLLAIWGSSGFLEIAVNSGSAKNKLNANVGDQFEINIHA
jgi:S-adenosylmethionine hydrolase